MSELKLFVFVAVIIIICIGGGLIAFFAMIFDRNYSNREPFYQGILLGLGSGMCVSAFFVFMTVGALGGIEP